MKNKTKEQNTLDRVGKTFCLNLFETVIPYNRTLKVKTWLS